MERKENVIFLGPPGVGKTHLAISLAIAAAQSGRRVYYGALADLITSLEEAKTTGQLGRRLKILTYPSLLVIDEIGYLPVSQTGAMLFFQLINRRYERASTVLTSNKGFEEWGQILGNYLVDTRYGNSYIRCMDNQSPLFSGSSERSATSASTLFMMRFPNSFSMASWSERSRMSLGNNRFFFLGF